MKLAALAAIALGVPALARADDAPPGSIIFARGGSLVRVDGNGKGEAEIATFDAGRHVRSLRTDAAGKVLLVDLDGGWAWMPLDGSAQALAPLPCDDGPAQLEEDGSHVVCRGAHGGGLDVNLSTGKGWPVDVPIARIVGTGANRRFMWAAADGIWTAPPRPRPRAAATATKVAPEPPLRAFLPSPDGTRAVGVYASEIYTDAHHQQPADVLMGFALDGIAARRMAIKSGVPIEWSHDGEWVLVQDGASACLMHATGGEYKCWPGYTAASIAADGKYALVLGAAGRHSAATHAPATAKATKRPPPPPPGPPPGDEGEGEDNAPLDDVAVPPPTGPLDLYRVQLEGSAFVEPPTTVARLVDGAAVWVPGP